MNWCSIDPSNRSGIAYWSGDKLIATTVLRRVGTKGKYKFDDNLCDCRWKVWDEALIHISQVVTEEGCGRFATAIKSQSSIRGYIEAVCDYNTANDRPTAFTAINVAEWRRVIKEAYGVSWPATTERKKELSKQLVKQNYGIDVSDDESDAVLLGVAAMRMGVVPLQEYEQAEGAK
jgi:hypothetical protein